MSGSTIAKDNMPSPDDHAAFIAWLRSRYMTNGRDQRFLDGLKEILQTDAVGNITSAPIRIGLVDETRGILVTGETGSGKTALIKRNLRVLPGIGVSDGAGPGAAFYVRITGELTSKGLAANIAASLGYPVAGRANTSEVWQIALHRLRMRGFSILWIDEAHHVLSGQQRQEALFRFKSIMQGKDAMALILSGIPRLREIISTDRETYERFLMRMSLGPVSTDADMVDLLQFIRWCCKTARIALPEEKLFMARRIVMANHGVLGRCIESVIGAVARCLRDGADRLELGHFESGYRLRAGDHGPGPFDDVPWDELSGRLHELGWVR